MNEPRGGRISLCLGSGGFSPKRPKKGSVNSVLMRFSITVFPGKMSDFRLKSELGGGSDPPKPTYA